MNLGEQIYNLRTERGMSQGDLADALEVSRQSVSKWETNTSVPELDKLVKMGVLFGVTLDELVTGKAPEPKLTTQGPDWGKRLALVLFGFSCISLVVTVLFEGPFGIHTHEGLLLAALFGFAGWRFWRQEPRKDESRTEA